MTKHKIGNGGVEDIPEGALGANTQILQDKPDANMLVNVKKTEGTGGQAPDEVPGVHALWGSGASDGVPGVEMGRTVLRTRVVGHTVEAVTGVGVGVVAVRRRDLILRGPVSMGLKETTRSDEWEGRLKHSRTG